ncbi:MAG: mechanosensitive ion channel family protein [Elusimicrobia bacterium]|nr:mechanosensitive ion channel family protein [Elusimicrobiota bacterium]
MTAKLQFILAAEFLNNTVLSYLYAAFFFAAALAGLYFLREIIFKRLKSLAAKTETGLDDMLVELISKLKSPEYQLVAFYAATRHLYKTALFDRLLFAALLLVFTYRIVTIVQRLISYWITRVAAKQELTAEARASVVNSTQVILKAAVWVAAALFILANLGVNISAVLTGLGIGGIAVALAAQTILGDLFNFFVILLDKPFIVGDFLVAGDIIGTVDHIGLKSIRIRSLSGELVIVSNSKLLGMGLKNYKQMQRRRVVFKTTVVYQTPPGKLKLVPGMIKEIVTGLEKTAFDRSNLSGLGDFSIDFETVYFVESPDYNFYMQTQERILQAIIEKFEEAKIEFAYPTQTLFVNK